MTPADLPASRRSKSIKLDPVSYFAGFAFVIQPAAWRALGLSWRTFVDSTKTKAMRDDAVANGASASDARLLKATYSCWARQEPAEHDFRPGDVFYHRTGATLLQVIANPDDEALEVHLIPLDTTHPSAAAEADPVPVSPACRQAHIVSSRALEAWLRSGHTPPHTRICRGQSLSDTLRFYISDDGAPSTTTPATPPPHHEHDDTA